MADSIFVVVLRWLKTNKWFIPKALAIILMSVALGVGLGFLLGPLAGVGIGLAALLVTAGIAVKTRFLLSPKSEVKVNPIFINYLEAQEWRRSQSGNEHEHERGRGRGPHLYINNLKRDRGGVGA